MTSFKTLLFALLYRVTKKIHCVVLFSTSEIHSKHSLVLVDPIRSHPLANLICLSTVSTTMGNGWVSYLVDWTMNIFSEASIQLEPSDLKFRDLRIRLLNLDCVMERLIPSQSGFALACRYGHHFMSVWGINLSRKIWPSWMETSLFDSKGYAYWIPKKPKIVSTSRRRTMWGIAAYLCRVHMSSVASEAFPSTSFNCPASFTVPHIYA